MRFLQYFPELQQRGLAVQHEPLFTDDYIAALQSGHAQRHIAVKALLRRSQALRTAKHFDLLWVEKDALPWLPAWLELGLLPKGVGLVLDYDDAVFHQYDMLTNPMLRRLLGGKHKALMRQATLVIAGNQYICDYATRAGARRVELLPTVVDLDRYQIASIPTGAVTHSLPTVGWIGQRSTAGFLRPLAPVFEQLRREGLLQFRAIGIDAPALGLPMDSEAWSESTEVASIQQLDVGIMPLEDGPFERGKCGYKLIQYMACGLPVVASPVGVNACIVEHGVNGFVASTAAEWEQSLRTLATSPSLRHRMGHAGRAKVAKEFCLQVAAPRLADWLHAAASGRGA